MELRGRNFIFLLIATVFIISLSEAHKYHVGGKGGWIVNPRIRYNHWSDRTRFVVNDSLVFKYEKGEDSVLLVTKDGYYNCDIKSHVERWEDGATEVALNRSGPFFFVSGVEEHCHKGQRLIVVVLPWSPQPPVALPPESPVLHPPHASPSHPPTVTPSSPEHHTPPPSPSKAPSLSPADHPPHASPSYPPTVTPSSPEHHAPPPSPSKAPSLSPADHPPASTPSPVIIPPTHSPTSTPPEAPSPQSLTPAAPAPAPEGSPSSAITIRHAPWFIAAVAVFLTAIF